MKNKNLNFSVFFFAFLLLITRFSDAHASLLSAKEFYGQGEYSRALAELKPLAEDGDPEAQTLLGTMYLNAQGTMKDSNQALTWYLKAASQGNTEAQIALSDLYSRGEGTKKNELLSAYWQWMAANAFARAAKNQLTSQIAKASPLTTVTVTGLPNLKGNPTAYKPEKDQGCKPDYPSEALKKRMDGAALVGGYIELNGHIENPIVFQSSGWEVLDLSAISFIKRCKFTPATINGMPTRSFVTIKQVWKIDESVHEEARP
jgi:TonB family protein